MLLKSRIKELIQRCFSKRERKTKVSVSLLLVEKNLTLSNTIQNLIININRTRSFKC